MVYDPTMSKEIEIIAEELKRANETLAEIKNHARFANQVLKIFIVLGAISFAASIALTYVGTK